MPRRRFLSAAAEAEALRFARDRAAKRSHPGGPWGEGPSMRDLVEHLRARDLLPKDRDTGKVLEPSRKTVWRVLERERDRARGAA